MLTPILEKFSPFKVVLDTMNKFDTIDHLTKEGVGTIHFEPDKNSYGKMKDIQKAVFEQFPYCNALARRGPFKPHLSVGVFDYSTLDEKMKELKNTYWKEPLEFEMTEVCMMSRVDGESPFVISHRIPLGRKQ